MSTSRVTIIQAASIRFAEKTGTSTPVDGDTEAVIEKLREASGLPKEEFEAAVNKQVEVLTANAEKAAANTHAKRVDEQKDLVEFEPLRVRRARANQRGELTGLKPGQEYLVMILAGEVKITESTPAKLGADRKFTRRKVVSVQSLYTPEEPKPVLPPGDIRRKRENAQTEKTSSTKKTKKKARPQSPPPTDPTEDTGATS